MGFCVKNIRISWRIFQPCCQYRNLHVQKQFFRKDKISEKITILMMTFGFWRSFWDIGRNCFSRDIKSAFYWSSGTFPGKKTWKTYKSMNFLGLRAKYVQMFGENFLRGLSKLHSSCPEEGFEGKTFFGKS